ncbi:MAG: cell division protein ZipA C-terminal FtsZ-binding domain-containing protein [Gammaproteobacteria bacterium]
MSLQLSLLLIGIIIIAIVAYTTLRRARSQPSERRMVVEPFVGLDTPSPDTAPIERREPSLDAVAPPPAPMTAAASAADLAPERRFLRPDAPVTDAPPPSRDALAAALQSIEEVAHRPLNLNPGFDPPGTGAARGADPAGSTLPDEHADLILHLPGPGPVSRRTALGIYKQNEYKLEYPRKLYGQRYHTNFWSLVQHDSEATQYSDLKLSLQLLDSRGPVSESELNTFTQVGLKLADALHRPAKFSASFEDALAQARRLQAFCDEHDVIAGINIVTTAQAPFKGHAISAAMQRHGLELGAMNIFHAMENGRVLYSVSSLYKPGHFSPTEWDTFRTAGLAVFMSVPVVREPAQAFERMMQTAAGLTAFLGGRLLDQEHRPLTEAGINAIRTQIEGIEARMRAFGIPAGSDTALRLFGSGG